ncbi:MAG TPA: NapC/NirT family cytochrome c [Phycisphaerae bacterium]|nr:NapC/NirT family cytochrome c [Phycisphaerae bacterium]
MRWNSFLRLLSISRISILGASMVTAAFISDMLLIVAEAFLFTGNPYIGIINYMILPVFIVAGLVLIPLGMFLRLRRLHRPLNLATLQRLARFGILQHPGAIAKTVALLTIINIIAFSILGYRGYHYMDSTAFCGQACHSVMSPEFTAYKRSPHSQVECVQCHIGPGATWFVKSKISGAWQVVAVTFNLYDKPIPTPIDNLRPARDVCESCHRPELFQGNLIRVIRHYTPDRDNTVTYTILNMRVGGGGDSLHQASGIHWHVAGNHQLKFYAPDHRRENIQWIEDAKSDGSKRVWTRPDSRISESDIDPAKLRTMDCVDCHNRPTHIFQSPDIAIDEAMAAGELDHDLPWIRRVAQQVITQPYATQTDAMEGIEKQTLHIYQEEFPDVWNADQPRIIKAIGVLRRIYSENVFPGMKINWNTYASQIGHPGPGAARCFRCHDGQFRSDNGKGQPIVLDCNACHYVLASDSKDPSVLWLLQRDTRLYGNQSPSPPATVKP